MVPMDIASGVDYCRLIGTHCSHSRLEAMHAFVVGAGALGNEVVRILGLLGFGKTTIVDPDRVESHNLTRSFFLRGHVGRNKAAALTDAASAVFPDTMFNALETEIADVGFEALRDVDVVFSCVDSDLARLELAYISTRLELFVCDGGLAVDDLSGGRVSCFPGHLAACYGCLLTEARRAELLVQSQSPVASCGISNDLDGLSVASTPMMSSIIAALQVETALRWLTDRRGAAFSLEVGLRPEPRIDRLTIPVSAGCPFHGFGEPRFQMPCDDISIQDYLLGSGLPWPSLVLDWPICLDVVCLSCGKRWNPSCRLGLVRRRKSCLQCGSSELRAGKTTTEIQFSSPLATLRFSQLGLPLDHSYVIRRGDSA